MKYIDEIKKCLLCSNIAYYKVGINYYCSLHREAANIAAKKSNIEQQRNRELSRDRRYFEKIK